MTCREDLTPHPPLRRGEGETSTYVVIPKLT